MLKRLSPTHQGGYPRLRPLLRTRPDTPARVLSDEVRQRIEEHLKGQRKRAQKARDQDTLRALVDLLVANLIWRTLGTDEGSELDHAWLTLPMGRSALQVTTADSGSPVSLLTLPHRVKEIEGLGLLVLDLAPRYSRAMRRSRIRPSEAFGDLLDRHRPRLNELENAPVKGGSTPECLELRREEVTLMHGVPWTEVKRQVPTDYRETEDTKRMRAEVAAINSMLSAANIDCDPAFLPDRGIMLSDRFMRRIFSNGRWDNGGRLYGGFWLNMPRESRAGLRIDGIPVVGLDFNAMFLRLLYAVKARCPIPEGDPYEFILPDQGWPADPVDKSVLRDAVKRNVSKLLSVSAEGPKGHRLVHGTKSAFGKHASGATFWQAAARRHPAIAPWFGTAAIYELMYLESEIMIRTLLMCHQEGIVCLPIHDGLLVRQDKAREAEGFMAGAWSVVTGDFGAAISTTAPEEAGLETPTIPDEPDTLD